MTNRRWQQIHRELLNYPCTTCGAQLGQECVIIDIPNRTRSENVGKIQPAPHAARHNLRNKERPPVLLPEFQPSPEVQRAVEFLKQAREELIVQVSQVDAALRYLTVP